MLIEETKILRGPNCWSQDHKLVVLKIKLNDTDSERPGSKGFHENDQSGNSAVAQSPQPHLKPSKTQEVLKDMLIQLHHLAGLSCPYASVQTDREKQHSYLIYSFLIEEVSVIAGETAVKLTTAVMENQPFDLAAEARELKRLKTRYSIGPTTSYILEEVIRRKIPFRQFDGGSLMTLGYGKKQKMIRTAVTDTTSGLGIEIAGDKEETKKLLDGAHLPIPRGITVDSEEELRERIGEVKFPFVIKPLDGNHGRGVTTDINSLEQALAAFRIASKISTGVIIEEYIKGDDYRFLVINYQFVAAAKRIPAYITGNGTSTIRQLVETANKNPDRGTGSEHVLAPILIDKTTERILQAKNLTPDSVLSAGQALYLKDTANISAGGTAVDVTDAVHAENKFMAEHVARLFKLDICGIDIMTNSVETPITRETGAIIEVNAGPGLRMHSNPQEGKPQNVAMPIIDMLFPQAHSCRIPVIAYAGAPDDTISDLIAYYAKEGGYKPGSTGHSGIHIDTHLTWKGNGTDFTSAEDVLFDPLIDFAILACECEEIENSGLAFDHCDVSILVNAGKSCSAQVPDLNENAIRVLAKSTTRAGYAILDADDEVIYHLKEELTCNVALFSMNAESARITKHIESGGLAAVCDGDMITVYKGKEKVRTISPSSIKFFSTPPSAELIREILPALITAEIYHLHP